MKKTVVLALILICLMALGMVYVLPVKAQYQNETDITINANGSINPSTAPIQQKGNIYTLTSDTAGSITVFRNNTILDGNGHATDGVIVGEITNVTITNFTITGGLTAITLTYSSKTTIANNTISQTANNSPLPFSGTSSGINVIGGSSNIITGNNLFNNTLAIYLLGTVQNIIVQNNITGSSFAGIDFDSSSNNIIYHNNFINNSIQAIDTGLYAFYQTVPLNTWDDGYPFGGNYWSDYKTVYPNATEIDSSRIGDMPYSVYVNNTDRYPLMEPFTTATYLLQNTPPKISLLSPLNQTYSKSTVSLAFSIDKPVNWISYSLDGQQNVTITGNTTLTNMTNGLHTLTVYANDTFGNVGASQTITFKIALTTFPTATVAAASGALAVVVVGAGLLVYFKKHRH